MDCRAFLCVEDDPDAALGEALGRLRDAVAVDRAFDLLTLFATPRYRPILGRLASAARAEGLARHVLGTTAESVAAVDREIEAAPALALWAARLPEGSTVTPVRLEASGSAVAGWPENATDHGSTLILLADPFTFPADRWFPELAPSAPALRVIGGMASGGFQPGANRLILDDAVADTGAVGVLLGGPFRVRTIVSQGCRPIGRPLIVTKAERNLVRELGRRPALEVFRELFEQLAPSEQGLVRDGLHLGRVINEYQESFGRGDFLVRNVAGATEDGGIALNDIVRVGQTVQFHVRDAGTADEDLRSLLDAARAEGSRPAGALLFTCNGRGTRLFANPHHDIRAIHDALGPVPTAGFFAMGEFGPVGGQTFVHGYTACVALFEE
jgi:small ligand-binding sensory domain FIST